MASSDRETIQGDTLEKGFDQGHYSWNALF